ncbi:hypothetical protein MBAV_000409 [Candidatus Magnetobacterium bavaricum]|uniref:DUF6398 domain-containing protein n=1 Tax=Candidatus Magnetobacterium bavaricum TaxID=29290 RepID=A0A0F3GZR6_9BACT|nr:hypothetical protein MBAV_000409 [Candidatus Magnetobacterium bavaricum]
MDKTNKSEKIPKELEALYDRITELIDDYCRKHLNNDYAKLARNAVVALCCSESAPVAKGHINTWACAILYTLCSVNRLFEDEQELHINASDLCNDFEISINTALSKSGVVAEILQINDNDPIWCLKKPDPKPAIKPETRPDTKSETKPRLKSEVKLEPEPDGKRYNKTAETTEDKKEPKKSRTKARGTNKDEIRIGDCVRVKKGVVDPDFVDSPIEGWYGRVIAFVDEDGSEEDKDNPLVDVEWDSFTLRGMTDDFIDRCDEDGLDCLSMYLRINDIEKARPRDTMQDVKEAQDEIHIYLDDPIAISQSNEQDKRILEILGNKDISIREETLACYLDYLEKNISPPLQLTVSEPFQWEELYLSGIGRKREYDKLKKTRPAYKDTFKFIKIERDLNMEDGILVKVQRLTDNKKFVLPLSNLQVVGNKLPNYRLVNDYSSWFVNN